MKHTLFAATMAAFSLTSCAQHGTTDSHDIVKDSIEIAEYGAQLKALQEQARQAYTKYGEIPDTMVARLDQEWDSIITKQERAKKEFVTNYKGTPQGAEMLLAVVKHCEDINELSNLMALYSDMADNENVKKAQNIYNGLKNKSVGAPVAELTMETPEGETMNLTDVVGKGNYVLVDFWASWCGPCKAELPNVKAAYEKYHSMGFEIVGVSFDSNKEAWTKCIADMQLTWKHMSDLKGWQCAAAETYSVYSIPSTILFSPDGKVVAVNLRGEALGEKLAEVYK